MQIHRDHPISPSPVLLRRLFSGNALRIVEGAGHYPHAEMPRLVGPRIIAFLKEQRDRYTP